MPVRPLGLLMSDDAPCFTVSAVQNLMKTFRTRWKTVLTYAPMSHGRAEPMFRTLNINIALVDTSSSVAQNTVFGRALFVYCHWSS